MKDLPFTIVNRQAWGGGQKKKSCNIVTTYVGGRTGNYTKFIFFSWSQFIQICKEIFFVGGLGVGWWVGILVVEAR